MSSFPSVPDYETVKDLGHGRSGSTYLVRREEQLYVLKTQQLEHVKSWKDRELFEREASILRQLTHPRIPAFVDLMIQQDKNTHSENLLLIQEHIAGQDLETCVQAGKRFSETEVVALALQMADVLKYLHSLQPPVIHRDIKPANIIMHEQKGAFLVDFGAVRDRVQQRSSTIVGTFGYMAPEQFDGRAYPATDIYALGVTLIFLLTHVHPGDMEKDVLRLNYKPHGQISKELAAVLDTMIAPDWKQRYQSAEALIHALKNRGKPPSQKRQRVLQVGLAALCLLLLLFYISAETEDEAKPLVQERLIQQPPVELTGELPRGLETARWRGQLTYRGQVMRQFKPEQVRFWFRDENTGKALPQTKGHYHQGHIWFSNLPESRVLIQVTLKTNTGWAKNFERSKTFNIFGNSTYPLNIELLKVIHLTSPEDNMQKLPHWDEVNNKKKLPEWSDPIHLAWEPLEGATSYSYKIENWRFDNGKYAGRNVVFEDTTTKTELYPTLTPSAPDSYYVFKLSAHDKEGKIGYLTVHGTRSKSWDYRFRIVP